jgi:outer membrane protein OmpA-like peptidoglycan-associated protein
MNKAKLAAIWRRRAWRWRQPWFGLGAGSVAALLAVSILTAGCSSSSDQPPPVSSTGTGTSSPSTGNESFPNLGSVPNQPPPASTPAERQAIMEGLISDRKNAVYSDQPLSGQPNISVPPPEPPQPITPEGGGTSLGTTTITPPSSNDTNSGTDAVTKTGTDAGPAMPAAPPAPVTSQPLPEPPPAAQPESATPPQPQSNAAPLAPGDLQYADLSGEAGMMIGDDSDADPVATIFPALTQIADSGQPATVAATTPRGLIPQGPFSYPQAKPRMAASSGSRSVIVDLSAIGGGPEPMAQPQPQQPAARPPLYVDLSVLDDGSAPAMQPQQALSQPAAYQLPAYQPGPGQLAIYQIPRNPNVTLVAASAIPLPPAGQPLGLIFFANGSAHLNAKSREVLHDVARIYIAQGGAIRVIGHASWVPGGDSLFNARLSYARAQAVARVLIADGVKGGDLEMRGVGITQPVYYETSRTGSAGNRRADVFLTP